MVRTCCVVFCNVRSHDRQGNKLENGLSFHSFPAWKQNEGAHVSDVTKRRRLAWIAAVGRADIQFSAIPRYLLVCSRHFHSGKPAYEMDETNPDWVPTLRMGHSEIPASSLDRHRRRMQRKQQRAAVGGKYKPPTSKIEKILSLSGFGNEAAESEGKACAQELPEMDTIEDQHHNHHVMEAVGKSCVGQVEAEVVAATQHCLGYDRPPPKKRRKLTQTTESQTASSNTNKDTESLPDCAVAPSVILDQASISKQPPELHVHSVHTQWEDPSQQDHQYCNRSTRKEVQDKMTQCDEVAYFILQNDADALLYTGIALETFNILVSTLEGCDDNEFTMPVRDQVLMTLMKLKSNRVIGDLSRQFRISQSMASKIILHWLDKLEEVFRPLIPWLPKETIKATMPAAFKKTFPNTTCIVDCSETFLQKPRNLDSRRRSYSHYYSSNTVKYLVAVAPSGLIMFVSAAYGSQCSEKFITMDSGMLTYLKPGDEVMTGGDLTLKDLLFEREVGLVIPSFTKKRGQLTKEQVTDTRRIANVRIHVERAIRRLKVYKILSQIVPISMAPKIGKILRICAALVNLREDIIRDTE
ncbi:uncharacterized protein LOC113018754 isoform X1 [Astatotilapia calliptera]|uniref:THAP-type domain-containing protein n=1 Tax=Astatotilapia calliptera TaxID=8154 RepID=A0A3P8NZQ9_ASTCA|nr:uncharacterized protein LOC113018754 isoform X1 [Astatotilapia calliptera]